ncbi:MAG: insulinase family protein, partial [Candidatus Dadabacteria bacterium]|nr:insulinase family protein [Candidatus Dadabacteria bacterium]
MTEDEVREIAKQASEEVSREMARNKGNGPDAAITGEELTEEIIIPSAGMNTGDRNTPASGAEAVKPAPGEVKKFVLDNGIQVLIKENPGVPLFAARAAFLGGVRYEDEKTQGMSNFISRMFTRGTESRSAAQIAEEIESIAGEVQGFSGRNSFGVTVESLSQNFGEAIDIFADVILRPSFESQEIERARREILSEINREGDNLLKTTVNLFLATLYADHPYKYNPLGTVETVTEFDGSDLREFYAKYVRPENMVITIVGDVDENEALEAVREKFGGMKKGASPAPEIKPVTAPSAITEKTETKPEKAQTHIIMGFLAPPINTEDEYAFEVLNTILSGQGGRLFIELRDKKSLAYTVTSFYTPGLEPGYFGVYIGTAPQKEEEAVNAIKEQLGLVLKDGVTDEELKRAQNYLVGSFEIGLQQNSSQAAKITFDELYGIGWE